MENEYVKKRRQLRFNLFLAMLLLLSSAMFAVIYGVVYLINEWPFSPSIAIASGVGAFALAFLLIGLFGIIYKRLRKKLDEVEAEFPREANVA